MGRSAGGRSRPKRRRVDIAPAVAAVLAGIRERGWGALLEIVEVSLVWALLVSSIALLWVVPKIIGSLGLVISLLIALVPFALVAPATVGLFYAADGFWSGEGISPLDALRFFGRGFVHRYLRSVGLGFVWALVLVATYANLREDVHFIPHFMLLGMGLLLLYLLLFFVMVHVYLLPTLATTDSTLWEGVRIGAWMAVANPMFTLIALLGPAIALTVGLVVHALLPMVFGGTLAMFSVGAFRHAPLRHPELPVPYRMDEPLPDPPPDGPREERDRR